MAKRSNLENAENPNPVSKKSLLAAKRMQRHRERRRRGIRSFSIDLWEAEVDELIRRGLLESKSRNDRNSVLLSTFFSTRHCRRVMRNIDVLRVTSHTACVEQSTSWRLINGRYRVGKLRRQVHNWTKGRSGRPRDHPLPLSRRASRHHQAAWRAAGRRPACGLARP
jgi:hypothetical protein